MKEQIEKIQAAINWVIEGHATQYVKFEHKDEDWTVRVSDHAANPDRMQENMISLVVDMPRRESAPNKCFKSHPSQFFLNSEGEFTENFYDLEECMDYLLN